MESEASQVIFHHPMARRSDPLRKSLLGQRILFLFLPFLLRSHPLLLLLDILLMTSYSWWTLSLRHLYESTMLKVSKLL